jgi:hypothetical protein
MRKLIKMKIVNLSMVIVGEFYLVVANREPPPNHNSRIEASINGRYLHFILSHSLLLLLVRSTLIKIIVIIILLIPSYGRELIALMFST